MVYVLFLDICVFELRHISPAWHGQRSVQDNLCSKDTQPLEQRALPLQVQIRSCKKSDDIASKEEVIHVLFPSQTAKDSYEVPGVRVSKYLAMHPEWYTALSIKVALLNNPDIL